MWQLLGGARLLVAAGAAGWCASGGAFTAIIKALNRFRPSDPFAPY
ncbi:hypothetical protein G155_00142 [Mycobacterium sp. VKM Ac-1817D]|nr:hypothetical protein G155_00142 [Mycobacterium sp. VKM Ac-1817D]